MEKVIGATMHRWTVQNQRKARENDQTDGTIEIWVNEGPPQIGIEKQDGDQTPPPRKPKTPEGYQAVGWKEEPNAVLISLKDAVAVGMPAAPVYEPNQKGKNTNSNDGDGAPPVGYSWTTRTRRKILHEEVAYTMTYVFKKLT